MSKLSQKKMQIIKKHALMHLHALSPKKGVDGETKYSFKKERVVPDGFKESEILVAINSHNPYSEFFSEYSVSTGMLDSHLKEEYVENLLIEKSNGKVGLSSAEKLMYVDDAQLTVETGGLATTEVLLVDRKNLGELEHALYLSKDARKNEHFYGSLEEVVGVHEVWRVGARSGSQTRDGDLTFIPSWKSLVEHLEKELLFKIESYARSVSPTTSEISVKIQNRMKTSASSGFEIPLFEDFKFVYKRSVRLRGIKDRIVMGTEYHFDTPVGRKVMLHSPEDFMVKMKQEVIAPHFVDGKAPVLRKSWETFYVPVTDGSMHVDMKYANSKGVMSDTQARVLPVMKGMLNLVHNQEHRTGYVFIAFGGAVKGDPSTYFEDSVTTTFQLGVARDERELADDYMMLSNQMVRDLANLEESTLDVFERDTEELLYRAYNQDVEALEIFVGLNKEDAEEVELEDGEIITGRNMDPENMTLETFHANPQVHVDSDAFRKRLSDFIRPASKEVENAGRYYAKDTSFRHMVSDPYEIQRHLVEGRIGYDAIKGTDKKGIAPDHVVTNSLRDGVFSMDERKTILGRFPLLHQLEIQVVNESGPMFLDAESELNYRKLMARGKHQGVIYYSIYDMTAEGQSGADYDGDTTVVIRNPEITGLVSSSPKFLDYSYLNGELVEGAPWKEDMNESLVDIIGQEKADFLEKNLVTYKEGLLRYENSALEDEAVRELIYETIVKLDAITNESNNIGKLTNLNSAVAELMTVLDDRRKQVVAVGQMELAEAIRKEYNGYKKLNFLLASAIRWEIDKSKHGGQFMEELSFLLLLLEPKRASSDAVLERAENKFGISLARLYARHANRNDDINKALDALNIPRIHLVRMEGDTSMINGTRSIFLGKGIDKGADYGSRYNKYINRMNELAEGFTSNFKINEFKNGLLTEANNLKEYMLQERGFEYDFEPLYNAQTAVDDGEPINSPVRMLVAYRKDIIDVTNDINELESFLISMLNEQAGGVVKNGPSLGLEALMDATNAPEEYRMRGFALLARKQLVFDYYKGLGEMYTPEDPMESALMFAELYLANIRSQVSTRETLLAEMPEQKMKEQVFAHKTALFKKWTKKHGEMAMPESTIIESNNWVYEKIAHEVHSDKGWGSIISLFPLSTVQFLEYLNHEVVLTDSIQGRNAMVFIRLNEGAPLPDNIKEGMSNIEGEKMTFENGVWNSFRIDRDDKAGVNKFINARQQDLEHLHNVERRDEIEKMKFERGAQLWNRKRQGTVVMSVVYDSGIRIFLEDTKEIM